MKIIEAPAKPVTKESKGFDQLKMKQKVAECTKLIEYMKKQGIMSDFLSQSTVTEDDIFMIQKVEHQDDLEMAIYFHFLFNKRLPQVQIELDRVYNKMKYYISTKTNVFNFLNVVHPMFELYGHSGKNRQLIVINKMCVFVDCVEDWLLDPKIDVHKLQKIVSELKVD